MIRATHWRVMSDPKMKNELTPTIKMSDHWLFITLERIHDGKLCFKTYIDDILTSLSVNKAGQNSMSSSRSKDLPASNFCRKVVTEAVSVSSFILLTPLNCLWEFWEVERRGALRERPPWWECDDDAGPFAEVGCWWAL